MKNIHSLKNKELDKDIYIICSGASMKNFNFKFLKDKTSISVNQIIFKSKSKYFIYKDFENSNLQKKKQFFSKNKINIISSENRFGDPENKLKNFINYNKFYTFKNLPKKNQKPDLKAINKKGYLINSYSTVGSAIHLASHLGAKNIFILGHDCCTYDGDYFFHKNYYKNKNFLGGRFKRKFFEEINKQTIKIITRIKKNYNVEVFSVFNDPTLLSIKRKTNIFF